MLGGKPVGLYHVPDIREIPHRIQVADPEHGSRSSEFDRHDLLHKAGAHEPIRLPRADVVEGPKDDRRDSMAPLVEPNKLFGEKLGEAVSVDRGLGSALVDRVLLGQYLSVDLGGTDVDQQSPGVSFRMASRRCRVPVRFTSIVPWGSASPSEMEVVAAR